MKILRKNKNTYRKAKWWEEHEMLGYISVALLFGAVILAAYFI